jgi:hypothetical protein
MATPNLNPKATTATTTTTTTTTTTITTASEDDSPWPEIERNYFTSMRQHRDEEDRLLQADYTARGETLRKQLVQNYQAQEDLLRRLQELKDEYDGRQAELEGLDRELGGVMEERGREREREDEERRAWFERYKRGGLAYRGVEGKEEKGEDREVVNGRDEDPDQTESEDSVLEGGMSDEADADDVRVNGELKHQRQQPATVGLETQHPAELEKDASNDQHLANGVQQQHGELQIEPTPELEKGTRDGGPGTTAQEEERPIAITEEQQMADAVKLPVAHGQNETEKEPPVNLEKDVSDTATPAELQQQEPRVVEEDMLDAEKLPSGHGQEEAEKEQPVDIQKDMPGTATTEGEQQVEPQVVEEEMPDAATLPNGREQGESPVMEHAKTPAVEHSTSETARPDDGDAMDGVEVNGGPELPEDRMPQANGEPIIESPRPDGQTSKPALAPAPAVDHSENDNKDTQQPMLNVEIPDASRTVYHSPTVEDIDMSDVEAPPVNETQDIELPPVFAQTASEAPAGPPSPSSSSDLSSRHTTPELDTPVSFPREHSPPATPEDTTSGDIEVLDESGEFLGRLEALDISNSLVDRIRERPVKRQVQIRQGRKFTAEDLEAVPQPQDGDARAFKFLSFYVQATGDLQERPCQDCAMNHGLYQGCVVLDDPHFPRCGNCEWNKKSCHGAALEASSSLRHSLPAKSPTKSPTKARISGGSFTAVNTRSGSQDDDEPSGSKEANTGPTKKGPRKSLPTTRKAPLPSTPAAASVQAEAAADRLPEINKAVLSLRDDGVVFTDPPMMRGVPLAKISSDHPYWESDWKPIEELVEPIHQKHQERYEQLEQSGSVDRDKHLANRDAKRGRTILKFLEDGEMHPYQLVGKQWINYRLTHYDTLFRLAQLLTEELPKMNLDVKPSEWLRHRMYEVSLEQGDKFDVAKWIGKAYHDRKIEQLREKNGFPRVGRPPAHASKKGDTGTGKKKSLKRKDPHQTPEATPSKPKLGTASKASPTASASSAAGQQRPKKIKIITSQPLPPPSEASPATATRKPKIILNSPFPPSATAEEPPMSSGLEYDGYTSTDSISDDRLHPNDWRLHQVKTRNFATNPGVTQYWHWVTEKKDAKFIEHQVLESVKPIKWSFFKKPYNFHLKLGDIQAVAFAKGSTKVIVTHKKGRDGKDLTQRGEVMAQFKRDRTKRRFLNFLGREKGIKIDEVTRYVFLFLDCVCE